jgi:hypothetical protein
MNTAKNVRLLAIGIWLACLAHLALATDDGLPPRRSFTPKVVEKTGPPVEITEQGDFSESAVRNGVLATREQCEKLSNGIWAETAQGDSACLRYWTAGFSPASANRRAMVFFSGDAWEGPGRMQPGYLSATNDALAGWVRNSGANLGLPYVFLARPGIFGASGDHMQRRRPAESRIVSAALDVLKSRMGIVEWVVAGYSGGGHVTSSLVTLRDDIVCAVPGGAPSSPRLRWQMLNVTRDSTGYDDSYEPTEHLRKGAVHPDLRIFVVGDPRDSNGVWPAQVVMADKARELGIAAEVIQAKGTGPRFHGGMDKLTRQIAGWCGQGLPTADVLRNAAAP